MEREGGIIVLDSAGVVGFGDVICRSQDEFLRSLRERDFDAAVVVAAGEGRLSLPKFLKAVAHKKPLLPILLVCEDCAELRTLVDAIVPPSPQRAIRREVAALIRRRRVMSECGLVGRSEALVAVADTILRIAKTDITVLIVGESGTGKELVAKAIHNHSPRSEGPFVAINCGAIPETLLESQLFGHKKGAFTGAHRDFGGFFEQARGGTLFLDEVAEVPPAVQVKLLRVLESGEFFPVGSAEPKRADVRIVAATNKDPKTLIKQGKFRADLYYRLCGVRIFIPPLRERPEDIPVLAAYFAAEAAHKHGASFAGFSDDALEAMMNYHWPGNVRELRNLVETAVLLADGAVVRGNDLKPYFAEHSQLGRMLPALQTEQPQEQTQLLSQILAVLRQNNVMLRAILERLETPPSLEAAEKEAIEEALRISGGSRKEAAKLLGISTRTLYRKLKKFGIK